MKGIYYKTRVYELKGEEIEDLGTIIVEKNFFGATEVVSRIGLDTYRLNQEPGLLEREIVASDIDKTGHYLFVRRKDLNRQAVATKKEIIDYLDNYDKMPFSKVVRDIRDHKEKHTYEKVNK